MFKELVACKGIKQESAISKDTMQILLFFWNKLQGVKEFTLNAKTRPQEDKDCSGQGKGRVIISKEGSDSLIFTEKGSWIAKEGAEVQFSNALRWTLDRPSGVISLEHLRHGLDNPVFLFQLAVSGKNSLSSVDSHLCEVDIYFATIHFNHHTVCLNWRVIGPNKNQNLDYYYS